MISVVIRPFKAGGVFYPAGTIVDPAGVTLYKSRIGEGKITVVDEHNIESVAYYLTVRHEVEDAETKLRTALDEVKKPAYTEEYLAKVKAAAEKHNVNMTDKTIAEVVAEVKAKQAASK